MFRRRGFVIAFVGILAVAFAGGVVSAQGGRGEPGGRPGGMGRNMMERFERMQERLGDRSLSWMFQMEHFERMRERLGDGSLGWMFESRPMRGFGMNIMVFIQEATGLSMPELRAALAEGRTLADLIEANGRTVEEVRAEIQTKVEAELAAAVASGRITQEQATLIAERAGAIFDALVARNFAPMWSSRQFMAGPRGQLLQDVAAAVNQDIADVLSQIQAGATLAEVLAQNGVALDAFITDHLATAQARLDAAVSSGRMSQSVADAWLNLRRAQLEDVLTRPLSGTAPTQSEG